jgi:hypothetical protein
MYRITRNKTVPHALRITFPTYERARQAIRRWLRSAQNVRGNAAISQFGFSIRPVI